MGCSTRVKQNKPQLLDMVDVHLLAGNYLVIKTGFISSSST